MKREICLFFVVILLLFTFAEGATRLLLWQRTPTGMEFREDIIYSYRPYTDIGNTTLNNIGCIGDDVSLPSSGQHPLTEKPEDYKVLLLGGSTSFSPEYVKHLKTALLKREPRLGERLKVFSCGRPRYTSYINRVNFEKHLAAYKPDVVVLYLGINDNIYNTFQWVDELPRVGYFDWKTLKQSAFFEFASYHLIDKRLRSKPSFDRPLRSKAILENNVTKIIKMVQENKMSVVLASFAISHPTTDPKLEQIIRKNESQMTHFWGDLSSTRLGVDEHNSLLRSIASDYSLPFANISPKIPKTRQFFLDLCHLTEPGYVKLVEALAPRIPLNKTR